MVQKKSGFTRLKYSAIFFSVVMFLLVLSVGCAIFMYYTKPSVTPKKNDELAELLNTTRASFEEQVKAHASIVTKNARMFFVQRYFTYPENDVLRKMANDELTKVRGEITDGTLFWVNNTDMKLYVDGKMSGITVDPSDPANSWYRESFIGSDGFIINAYYDSTTRNSSMRICAPVYSAERLPIGVIGIESDLAAFTGKIYKKRKAGAEIFFFNIIGEISCARDIRSIIDKTNIKEKYGYLGKEMVDAAQKLRYGETQTFTSPIGDIAISRLTDFDWFAIAVTPHAKSDHINSLIWYASITAGALFVLLLLFNMIIIGLFKPLRETMSALEAALKVKGDFLARMSHEIRTPMNAITGMAELALREEMSTPAQEHVYTIKQAGANLLSIINDILDLSKIESGNLNIILAEYHFSSLVNDVVSIIRMRVMSSKVRFTVNIDSKIPSVLIGDEVRIRQILLNILSNAVKYTASGFISLTINGEIDDDDTVILTIDVADSGKGIKKDDIEKLFSAFVQVDVESNRGIEGTGLGLVITRNLTTAMNGRISVESEYGKGSTFTVVLPQKIYTSAPSATVDNPHEKSVLLYERRDVYSNSIACTVDNLGVRCICVQSHDEVRAKLRERDYPFLFIVADFYEDIKVILAETGSKAKVVLLTSYGNVVADRALSVIAMPAHSVSVANILNGVFDGFSYHTDDTTVVKFNAPDARVLVVDDIQTNLEVTRGLLSPYDMKVDICLSGAEAIKLAAANDYDLIFMDHMMPEMDGVEATKRIRDIGGICAKVPIVALTANAVSGAKEMFLRNDFNGFLSKPVDIPNLNAVLERWIPKKKQMPVAKKTEHIDASEPEFSVKGIDVTVGIARMGGSIETYKRTLSVFCRDGWNKLTEIKACLTSEDIGQLAAKMHAVKGAAANIGATDISESAKALEHAGKRGDAQFVKFNVDKFIEDLEKLLRNVEKALAVKDEKAPSASAADMTAVKAALETLGIAIVDLDPDAINAASTKLRNYDVGGDVGAKIEIVLQNALIGEYDKAVKQIQWLIKHTEGG